MTPSEFVAARKWLPDTDAELAGTLRVPITRLDEWAAGGRRIPSDVAHFLVTMSVIMRREAALATSGLPECDWMRNSAEAARGKSEGALRELTQQVGAHEAACHVCRKREQYARAQVGAIPVGAPTPSRLARAWGYFEKLWSIAVWTMLLIVGLGSGMSTEPLFWLVLSVPGLLWVWLRWRRRHVR